MASIYGYSIKPPKSQTTDGNTCCIFEICVGKTKKTIGYAEDNGDGNLEIKIFEERERKKFNAAVKRYFEENPDYYTNEEDFLEELLTLTNIENLYKNNTKMGYPILVELRYRQRDPKIYHEPIKGNSIISALSEQTIPQILNKHQPIEYRVFKNIADFTVCEANTQIFIRFAA